MKQYVNHTEYISSLLAYKDKDLIKVISGLRRSGKLGFFQCFVECPMDHEIILFIFDKAFDIERINSHKKTSTHVLVFFIVIS